VALGQLSNPLQAITEELANQRRQGQPVGTLHIVAHGRPGTFQIGGQWVDAASLIANARQLAQWQVPSIAVWSCEFGADRNVVALLEELTGSSVATTSKPIEGSNPASWSIGDGQVQAISLEQIVDRQLLESWQGSLPGSFVDVAGQALDFSDSADDVRISGSANQVGESWFYKDVFISGSTHVDAIVSFDSITSGSTMSAFDSTSTPYTGSTAEQYIQQNFTWGSSGGSALITVSFIEIEHASNDKLQVYCVKSYIKGNSFVSKDILNEPSIELRSLKELRIFFFS
jgi:hypothetical protein